MVNNFQLSKSDRMRLELSVTMGCGRFCSYCPQDLYIERYKRLGDQQERALTLEAIVAMSPNIPDETIISWTGFTEPFDCKDFGAITSHFADRRMDQLISTTLYGEKRNKDFFLEHLDLFGAGITLHLPDSQGYMKGKFDERYKIYVERVLDRLVTKPAIDFNIFLVGDGFHPSISSLIADFEVSCGSHRIIKAKYLNTRNSSVQVDVFGLKATHAHRSIGKTFYCTYRRLNRGVLLPNGSVVICSQDYGLECILGSLKTSNLKDIYSVIESSPELSAQFLQGEFSPCIKCEHYATLDADSSSGRTD